MRRVRRHARAVSWPAYLETFQSGELGRRAEQALAALGSCRLCPRNCGADRLRGRAMACKVGRWARVSSCFAHFGEEDPLRGYAGSGTIFFTFCNLRCVFCQNWETSQQGVGSEVGARELAEMMLELQEQACHNINFVTPEHVVPQILEALVLAVEGGLRIPLVYNTSAYDSLESLRWMDGVVDIYMPDFKCWRPETAARLLKAEDYPEVARESLREMHRQVGALEVEDGIARRGVLIRHLVVPGALEETREILRWLGRELGANSYVNLMDQYRPEGRVLREPGRFPELTRTLSEAELRLALVHAREAGLSRLDERRPHPLLHARRRWLL
ncbi:MAG: radical SAM protein [Myxococcales bacterium]|nr:radical SAM protein [Myxococcales bacterium]